MDILLSIFTGLSAASVMIMLASFCLGILAGLILEALWVKLWGAGSSNQVDQATEALRAEKAQLSQVVLDTQAQSDALQQQLGVLQTEKAQLSEAALEAQAQVDELQQQVDALNQAVTLAQEAQPELEADFSRLGGVGPKVAAALREQLGLKYYSELAAMGQDELLTQLRESGVRYTKANAQTWPEQAKLAAAGRWGELEQLLQAK